MNDIVIFTIGLIVGLLSMSLIILLWAMMTASGRISREEENRGDNHAER